MKTCDSLFGENINPREDFSLHSTKYTRWTLFHFGPISVLFTCNGCDVFSLPQTLAFGSHSAISGCITSALYQLGLKASAAEKNGCHPHAFSQHCCHFIDNFFNCGINAQEEGSQLNPVHMKGHVQNHCGATH